MKCYDLLGQRFLALAISYQDKQSVSLHIFKNPLL